jgi:hypothetical protein
MLRRKYRGAHRCDDGLERLGQLAGVGSRHVPFRKGISLVRPEFIWCRPERLGYRLVRVDATFRRSRIGPQIRPGHEVGWRGVGGPALSR